MIIWPLSAFSIADSVKRCQRGCLDNSGRAHLCGPDERLVCPLVYACSAEDKVDMRLLLPLLFLLWLTAAVFGMTRLDRFSTKPGVLGHPPTHWQMTAGIMLDRTRPTLVMFVHPKCPCTRASLAELNRLAALCPGRAAVFVLLWDPKGYSETWARTELYSEAKAIPGVQVRFDRDGMAARRLGAATSGETLLYAPDGRLLFQGGLTGSRGHEGDNAGLSAIVARLRGTSDAARQTPVYGCPLLGCRTRESNLHL
jgi:hypothetical protein